MKFTQAYDTVPDNYHWVSSFPKGHSSKHCLLIGVGGIPHAHHS